MGDITALLKRAAANDPAAWDEVFGLLYDDVHRMARARLAGNQPMTLLDTTGLAHETYLRFRNAERIDVASRAQLMAYVSQVLRAVIVDFARKRAAERRGGGRIRVTLDTDLADSIAGADADVAHVADALEALEASDPRLRRVVEMRFFGGMTDAEIGAAGGQARLVAFGSFGTDAHELFSSPRGAPVWLPEVGAFFTELGLPFALSKA